MNLAQELMAVTQRKRKGWQPMRGDAHVRAKLTESRVRAIRKDHKAGMSFAALARREGVRIQTVIDAIRGRTWTHVR